MKKLILVMFCVSTFFISNAQEIWLDAGIKGGFGLTILGNKNLFDDNTYSHLLSGSYNGGAKFGINFGTTHGITFDAMLSRQNQKFDYTVGGVDFSNELTWTNLDMYLLYRASMSGAYIELGPMLSNLRSMKQVDTGRILDASVDSAESFYSEKSYHAVFGVGGYMAGAENFTVMVGLRAHYALDDFISERGGAGMTSPSPYPATVSQNTYDSYVETRPIFIEFMVELNFGIGYFARTTCGGRKKFVGGNGRY